ncbi:MAG TPA: Hsp20/alpha crystallin family protein [Burkholderiaceae bacterium]|jgi:HSP20 family protein|nr:Hsp20/alpha crystallin family protein [Burkholderiaceae bacterium]
MFESLLSYPGSLFAEFDRLRREVDEMFGLAGLPASIRSVAPGAFPAINIGSTPTSVEIYAFAPGIDPSKVEVVVDRGVLTIAGERAADVPDNDARVSVYSNERFAGRFRRAIALPDDADPGKVEAKYRDGVLHITVGRRESALPKRITVQ